MDSAQPDAASIADDVIFRPAANVRASRRDHRCARADDHLAKCLIERLAAAEIDPSVGTFGGSHACALADSAIDSFKTEVINQLGSWKSLAAVAWETLRWVDSYNNRRG